MIVWLSSYPKSGNTWVRTFLSNYLFDESENPLENIKKIQAYPRFRHFDFLSSNDLKTIGDREQNYKFHLIAQERLNLNGKLNILKTHNYFGALNNYYFTNENNSFGFIYFVRDPRSVAVSLSHHTNKNFDKTIEMMLNKNQFMKPENQNGLIEFFSSWKINYLSWKRSKLPKLIIKYEDLKGNSKDNFLKILNFLKKFDSKIQIDEKKIDRISQKCEFDNLQKLEKKFGFDERKGNSLFFRNAKNEEWKDVLTSSQLDLLNNEFQNEMKDLGYL